jgi:nucleoside-triphosphatase THEP1
MIVIITGDINSGKSRYLLSLFHKNKTGDGFYNRRIFHASTCIGQEIVHLSTGKTCPFSYQSDHIPEHWDELYTYQDHSFSRSGIHFCQAILKNLIDNPQPCYIDEIGPLELQEKGLFHEFQQILQTKKDIYVVIRNRCLSEVLLKFNIDSSTVHTINIIGPVR